MNVYSITPFIRYAHYIEPQYLRNLKTRLGYDHRIFFCESGCIQISAGNVSFELKKNSLLYVPSGVVYVLGEHDEGTKIIGINFDFSFSFSHLTTPIAPAISKESYDTERQLEVAGFEDVEHFDAPFVLHGQGEIGALVYKIFSEFGTARIYHEQTESAILKQALLLAARTLTLGTDKAPQKAVNVVIAYVQENYMRDISNADVGQALNFHPNYLNRLMLKHTGRSLHRYLLYYRLTKALDKLQSTSLSVADIAEQCGFSDTGHFTKAFKKQFGSTPKEMRERII